ncbi:MAG: lysylphosphatidylglycerol synthase transmembrane domain-containing protein [Anaerolineales bacterium]
MTKFPQTTSLFRRILPGLILGFVVFLGLLLIGDIRKTEATFREFQWSLFLLVLAFTLFNYLFRFLKWHYYLRLAGEKEISPLTSAKLFIAGLPLAVTPGNVGEGLKGVWLHQQGKLTISEGLSVVTAERISDALGVLTLSTLGVIAYPRYWPVFAGSLVFILAVIILSQIRPLALRLLAWGERLPLVKQFAGPLSDFYESSYVLLQPRATLTGLVLGTISWLGEGAGMYVVLRGLNVPPSLESFSLAVFITSFSTVVGGISTLPGGLGAAEVSLAGMLTLLLGLNADTASAGTLIIRFGTLWFGVSLGLLVWSLSPDLLRFIPEEEEPT